MTLDFSTLPWNELYRSIHQGDIRSIQSHLEQLYKDVLSHQGEYSEMSKSSKRDFRQDRELYENTISLQTLEYDTIVPHNIQYRIGELWIRFRQLLRNRSILSIQELVQELLYLCVMLKYRVLYRRLDMLDKMDDALIVGEYT